MAKPSLKDILSILDTPADLIEGLEKGEKTIDDFQTFHKTGFVPKAMVFEDEDVKKRLDQVGGNITGRLTQKIKTLVDLENKEIEGKKVEEVAELAIGRLKSQIEELQNTGKKSKDEKTAEYETKLQKLTSDLNGYKSLAEKNSADLELERKNSQKIVKDFKLSHVVKEIKSKIPLKDGISELEKAGFDTYINQNYRIDLSDSDELEVYNAKGERVKSETGNKFVGFDELLISEAKKHGILKVVNTQKANPVYTPPVINTGGSNGNPDKVNTTAQDILNWNKAQRQVKVVR